jgi:hypothetical protein
MAVRITITNLEVVAETKERVKQVILASLMDLGNDLRDNTPVKFGFAVNSWQEQADGQPAPLELPKGYQNLDRGAPDPATLFKGIGGIASLVNTAAYIGPLADGWSPQAPKGWVEAAAARFQDHLDKHAMLSEGRS